MRAAWAIPSLLGLALVGACSPDTLLIVRVQSDLPTSQLDVIEARVRVGDAAGATRDLGEIRRHPELLAACERRSEYRAIETRLAVAQIPSTS